MTDGPSDHDDEFDMLYVLGRHGWSDLTIYRWRAASSIEHVRITHIFSNPMQSLIDLCGSVAETGGGHAFLHDEPGGTHLIARRDADRHHLTRLRVVKVRQHEGGPERGDELLAMTVKRSQLVTVLTSQLDKTRRLMREPSFAQGRDAFPEHPFAALREQLRQAKH